MPTARQRYAVTETDELARALDEAARHWPEDKDSRSRLLLRLIDEGYRSITASVAERVLARRIAIEETHGLLADAYGPDYLERLRRDWER